MPTRADPLVALWPTTPDHGNTGRYNVVRPHRAGGLGEVFVAADTELQREVALKRMRPHLVADPASRERFVREAEITGRLEHPGIVPVYGLGTNADDPPFYAMRLVRGDTLREAIELFHAAKPLAFDGVVFRQLLQRFATVCQTVAYAHSRGVLHRDLKPDNILLGPFGEVLVIDWGLARNFDRPASESRPVETATIRPSPLPPTTAETANDGTALGSAAGTPGYMAPEQAAGRWDIIGPAADVYALGAVLYAMLTNRPPVTGSNTPEVMNRTQRGAVDPVRTVQPAAPRALAAVAAQALALEPADRYASASDLAAEIDRYLADERVHADHEPPLAQAGRWIRKHRSLVVGTIASLAVGVLALAVATWLLTAANQRERRATLAEVAARQMAERQRDNARLARRQTRQALDAMLSEDGTEWLVSKQELTPAQRQFLERVVKEYQALAVGDTDDVEERIDIADANYRAGWVNHRLSRITEAANYYRLAIAAQKRLADELPDRAQRRVALATTHNNLGLLLSRHGQPAAAETAYRAAIALQHQVADDLPGEPPRRADLARTYSNLGLVLADQGQPANAATAYRTALTLQQRLIDEMPGQPERRIELARTQHNLGLLLYSQGQFPDAETAYRAALALQQRLADELPGQPHRKSEFAHTHTSLGMVLNAQGKPAEAERLYRAALVLQQRLADDSPGQPDYRAALAATHNNLGIALFGQGKPADAEVALRAAIAHYRWLTEELSDQIKHRADLASCYSNLGPILLARKQFAEAEEAYRAAIALQEQLVRDQPDYLGYAVSLGGSHSNFGSLLNLRGNSDASLAEFSRAITTLAKALERSPHNATARRFLCNSFYGRARVNVRLDRFADATADFGRALDYDYGPPGPACHIGRANARAHLGDIPAALAEADEVSRSATLNAGELYDLACVYAFAADPASAERDARAARAVGLLRRAVDAGYRNFRHLLADADLASLHPFPGWLDFLWECAESSPTRR